MGFQIWAHLAKEAVLLGEFRAAGEYLSEAQKHNDAFQDRENVARLAQVCRAMPHISVLRLFVFAKKLPSFYSFFPQRN